MFKARQYTLIASLIREQRDNLLRQGRDPAALEELSFAFADRFAATNAKFKRALFLRLAGVKQ